MVGAMRSSISRDTLLRPEATSPSLGEELLTACLLVFLFTCQLIIINYALFIVIFFVSLQCEKTVIHIARNNGGGGCELSPDVGD